MGREEIIGTLRERHEGTRVFYTSCPQNGCWDSACILKCHEKDGKLVAVEPDDTINPGNAREDVDFEQIWRGMVQMRPCSMGHAWKKELESPTRILHPMKRVGGKGAGKGHFVEISWEEALDTIAEKMLETKEKYGPYGIFHTQYGSFGKNGFPLAPYWEASFGCWGDHSTSGHTAGENFHLGFDLTKSMVSGDSPALPGSEASDIFNSKLIVLWGMDPVVDWFGSVSYYMQLAHEYGIKVIVIDPRYTASCEVLADQWIPIRPGTDLAMLLAVTYVLFDEGLCDNEYVDQWMEPVGLAKYQDYIFGKTDGEPKTPEWAEGICAVPAETIREFARLYGTTKPVRLQYFYSCAKRHLGEYGAAAAMLLQAMTGNIACPGGCQTGSALPTPGRIPTPMADFGRAKTDYRVPALINNNKLTETLNIQEEYWSGHMSEDEFRHRIGAPSDDSPLPNIHMLIIENNYVNNHHHTNKRMNGFAKVDFSWGFQWHMNQPTAQFCDIVLPAPVYMFEGMDQFMYGHERWVSGPSGMRNYFVYCAPGLPYPGEVRPKEWVYTELAKRLGVVDQYNPRMKDVALENWVEECEKIYREAYEEWAADEDGMLRYLGIEPLSWDDFQKSPVVRIPIDRPFYPYMTCLENGINPFQTASGKIECYSSYVAETDLTKTKWRGQFEPMPTWRPAYMEGREGEDSFYNPKAKDYPLSLVTPVSIYRQHSSNDNNPLLRDDCYRHAVWISAVDAKARGINDGDSVRVFNEFGEMIVSAYVTSRMMPGTAAVHHGAWYQGTGKPTELNPFGMDTRGAPNLLIGDTHLPHILGALLIAGLVQVERAEGDDE